MHNNYPTVSIIISTYNWKEALELSLLSIANQTLLPNEVIIADDGSSKDTSNLIDELKTHFPIPLVHVWQEDDGFRLAQIRNKAIAVAKYDYIIQIDGDIVLSKYFVEDHLKVSASNCFITGSRVSLNKELSLKVLKQKSISISPLSNGVKNHLNALHIPLLTKYYMDRYKKNNPYYGRGCNMSFWRDDLLSVNGYNEDFRGWGKEDTELMVRLVALGKKKRFIKFGAIAYHLYHEEHSRESEKENIAMLNAIKESKTTYCPIGLDQYL